MIPHLLFFFLSTTNCDTIQFQWPYGQGREVWILNHCLDNDNILMALTLLIIVNYIHENDNGPTFA